MPEISDSDIKPLPTPLMVHLQTYYREIVVLAVIVILMYAWIIG